MNLGFQVHKPDLGQMQQYMQEQEKKKDGGNFDDGPKVQWWDFPAGLSVIRVMPPWDPTGRVALPVFTHRIEFKGQNMKYPKYNWTCMNATFGKPCVICDALAEVQAAGANVDDYGPWSKKFYFNAVVVHDPIYHQMVEQQGKDPKDVPGVAPGTHVLVKSPKTVYDWIIAQITSPMVGDVTDVENGIDIYVTKEGKGLGTKYTPTLSPNGRQPVPQDYLNKIDGLYNPDEIFGKSYEEDVLKELTDHLKRSAGVMSGGGLANTHAAMGGVPGGAPSAPTIPGAGFGATAPGVPPMPGVPTAPPVAPPPVAPPPVAPQEHIDAQGNRYLLINNEWVLQPAQPVAPPTPPAPPAPPVAPPPPVAPSAPLTSPPPVSPPPSAPPIPPVAPTVPTAPPEGAPPSAPADAGATGRPLCFGQHNPADVKCVVCPFEMDCSQSKQ